MKKEEAQKRILELRETVEYHAKRYYDDDAPEISDFEYDMLMVELRNLEKQFPDFLSKDSLTQKVGGHVKEGFEKVQHEVPLQSLQDIFSFEELDEFIERVTKQAEEYHEPLAYVVEAKIDGLSVALEYKNGVLVRGATRGNGLIGEDVTDNLKTVKSIPKQLKEKINITVRGEVFIGKKEFAKMNGKTTLEMTPGGAYLDNLKLFSKNSPLTTEEATNVWARLSARYAQNASGNIYGFC